MHELLILAPDIWKQRLERLVRFKNDTGMPAALLTLGQIRTGFPGVDDAERIKRAIELHHRLHGVRYVLLAGDVDQFPVRYINAVNTEWGMRWYPSDLYYADLYTAAGAFDTWDANANGVFGELDFAQTSNGDKFNIDKIGIVPDVAVGRVPASGESEIDNYIDKVIRYEFAAHESLHFQNPDAWFRRALFVVDGGSAPFGDETQSQQQALPLPAAGLNTIFRYQDDAPWATATGAQRAAEINRLLNAGLGFMHVSGHGGRTGFAGWYGKNDLPGLMNRDKLPIVFAISCYTAAFHTDPDAYEQLLGGDWTGTGVAAGSRPRPASVQPARHDRDSMAEGFLVQRDTGAIAYIGAVSKFEHGGKPLGQYFTEAYRDLGKPPILGAMWRRALERFTVTELGGGTIGMGPYYAFIHVHKVMLFGDPSLRVGGLAAPSPSIGQAVLTPALAAAAVSA